MHVHAPTTFLAKSSRPLPALRPRDIRLDGVRRVSGLAAIFSDAAHLHGEGGHGWSLVAPSVKSAIPN